MAANDLNGAMKAVELAYHYDPDEFETRRLLSDVLLAQKRVEDALVVMEELHADGYPVLGELASMEKRAAFVKLLKDEREAALDLFSRARSHGLNQDELGSGAQMLMDAALSALNEGVEAYEALDFERACARFERAVELDPGLLSAHNHLGVVYYQAEDDEAAIEHWAEVWRVASAEGLILPEPVEINLARAYVRSGAVEDAKRILKESLEASPKGPHSVGVQRHLDAISVE
jgi:tetratricopeptide (TPR) repeat protein